MKKCRSVTSRLFPSVVKVLTLTTLYFVEIIHKYHAIQHKFQFNNINSIFLKHPLPSMQHFTLNVV